MSMRIHEKNSMAPTVIFALAWLIQKLLAVNLLILIMTSFTPETSILPELKITCVKIVDLVRPYPMPFTACL